MREIFRTYTILASAVVRGQMQYRFGMITRAVGLVLVYAGTLVNLYFMADRFGDIHGWNFGGLIFLFGLAVLSWGVVLITFFHFRNLDEYIISGQFDMFLTRPIPPFVHFMAASFPVFSVAQLSFSIALFLWATTLVEIDWTPLKWLYLLATVIGGAMIQGAACIVTGAVAFWTGRSRSIYQAVVRPAREMAFYPIDIYPLAIQAVFIWIFPLAFVNYYPAHVFLDRTGNFPAWVPFLTPLVGVLCLTLAYRVWMWGLRNYQGTGS